MMVRSTVSSLFLTDSSLQWSDVYPGYSPPLEAPKFVPKTTCLAPNAPSLVTLGTAWQARQSEFVKRILIALQDFGLEMRPNVNVRNTGIYILVLIMQK